MTSSPCNPGISRRGIDGGHGALLSPLPPGLTGLVGELLNDPPGFDRPATTALVDAGITAFFRRHLLDDGRSGTTVAPPP